MFSLFSFSSHNQPGQLFHHKKKNLSMNKISAGRAISLRLTHTKTTKNYHRSLKGAIYSVGLKCNKSREA